MITLKYNSYIFENIVIARIPSDDRTKKISKQYHNIECIETEIFYKDSCVLNKGYGLNLGL